MAIFHDTRRKGRTTFDDAVRSTDGALNALVAVLLIALAFAFWYYYGRIFPTADNANAPAITAPVTAPPVPRASPTPPAPSPSPGP